MKNINENVIDKMKKIVKDKQAMKIDGVMVDLYTASAVTQIYDKVNPANKKKMENMSPQGLATAAFKILGKKESVSEDASGMNPKQKMKFDQLMKKLDGGKEHMKFKRMAKNSVQGDDMFHGYVKDLAMKEQTEITEYTAVSPKMAKVFDSLKVGDKFTYKTKRYSSDGLKVTKKEILRGNLAGVERITVGKGGVYLFKWEKTKELVMRSGNMPITITDLVKESMNETVQINEVQQKEVDALKKLSKDMQAVLQDFYKIAGMGDKELKNSKYNKDFQAIRKSRDTILSLIGKVNTQKILNKESMNETVQIENWQGSGSDHDFSPIQLSRLKKAYSTLKGIDPSSQNYKKLKTWIRKLDVNRLEQLARAKIRFVSTIAAGEYAIKSGKRLHARDYLESTVMEKAMTLGGTNAPSGETYMGDKGIQKMVALSKKNPNIEYTVKSDNYGEFKPHWLKNGKFAKRTVANINFDMDKNAVRGVPTGKTVKSTIFVLRYSVNEGVQMENVKISFHSKGAKTKWMKKQGVASKEIINQTPTSIELPSRWKDLSKKKDHDEIFSVVMENDEYDNEGGMALSQLRTAKSAVEDLMSSIKEMDNLPEWVQSKLTKAVDYMDSVRDYMASEEGEEPVNESDLSKMQSADTVARKKSRDMNIKKDRVSDNKKRAIYRLSKEKDSATKGSGIKKDSPEMKKINKTYVNKVQKIMQEENVDESMARARADARRHMGSRGAQRGMAPLKKDSDISASDADRKAANKNIIMQIRKAADLPNGAEVEFPSGKKKLDRNTAQQLLTKFGSLRRSSEKDDFQKSIKSLSDVKKLIGR
jgi:hypothetical protein